MKKPQDTQSNPLGLVQSPPMSVRKGKVDCLKIDEPVARWGKKGLQCRREVGGDAPGESRAMWRRWR